MSVIATAFYDAKITVLVKEGHSIHEIARQLTNTTGKQISFKETALRIKDLKLSKPNRQTGKWATEIITRLRYLWDRGYTFQEMAQDLNRKFTVFVYGALDIENHIKVLNWPISSMQKWRKFWTPERTNRLTEMVKDKKSWGVMSSAIGVDRSSIRVRLTELGFMGMDRSGVDKFVAGHA